MADDLFDRLEHFEELMRQRLVEIAEIQRAGAETRETVTLDQSRVGRLSRIDAMQAQQMAAETARRRQIEVQRIRAALKRLEDGEYGCCVRCGEEIQIKRLEHDPSSPLCIACARR